MKNKNLNSMCPTSKFNKEDRHNEDFYATEPKATELLLEVETFNNDIWECACGKGHISEVLSKKGYNVKSTDLVDRGYGIGNTDFLLQTEKWNGDIITNPPFKYAEQFLQKGLELIENGNHVILFLKVQFLEGKNRKKMFTENPPKKIYVSSSRLKCARNGEFDKYKADVMLFCWFIWEKGYKGDTIVKWYN